MFDRLRAMGFQIDTLHHANAILSVDFPNVADELEQILLRSSVPVEEIIGAGGGETKGTQRLRRALLAAGWQKHIFTVQRVIDGKPLESKSHEIDHIRAFDAGVVALEIEWNNKDPFFDRDLENFKRLHVDGAISVGIIVTRGRDLQDRMPEFVRRFAAENDWLLGRRSCFFDQSVNLTRVLTERHNRRWQTDQHQRTGTSHASFDPVLQFAPVRRRGAEFVCNKLIHPRFAEGDGIFLALDALHHCFALARCGIYPEWFQVIKATDVLLEFYSAAISKALLFLYVGQSGR